MDSVILGSLSCLGTIALSTFVIVAFIVLERISDGDFKSTLAGGMIIGALSSIIGWLLAMVMGYQLSLPQMILGGVGTGGVIGVAVTFSLRLWDRLVRSTPKKQK